MPNLPPLAACSLRHGVTPRTLPSAARMTSAPGGVVSIFHTMFFTVGCVAIVGCGSGRRSTTAKPIAERTIAVAAGIASRFSSSPGARIFVGSCVCPTPASEGRGSYAVPRLGDHGLHARG